jgi:hypothetical protein
MAQAQPELISEKGSDSVSRLNYDSSAAVYRSIAWRNSSASATARRAVASSMYDSGS